MIALLRDFKTYSKFENETKVYYFPYSTDELKFNRYVPATPIKCGILIEALDPWNSIEKTIRKVNKDGNLSKARIILYDKCVSDNYEEIKEYYDKLIDNEIKYLDEQKEKLERMKK